MRCSSNAAALFWLFLWCVVLLASPTDQLRNYETQVLLQLRKHLDYPTFLSDWENYGGDFCTYNSPPHVTIKCDNDSVTELRIIGDMPSPSPSPADFIGYAIPTRTLPPTFSTDSFITTLSRLSSLRVVSLESLGIWGTLPGKIHRLSSLQVLDMSSNFLFGSIPYEMSRMAKLQSLSFDANFFNDTLPDWLDSLKNLTILSLKNNLMEGQVPNGLSRITTLTELVLSHNLLTGKLPDLSGLSNLQLIDFRDNKLDLELPPLPKELANIFLSNNSFSGGISDQFGKLDKLQHLDLSQNHLTGTPPALLFSLPNISYLNLSYNSLSGSLPENFKCSDTLTLVDISNNRLIGQIPSCLNTSLDNRMVTIGGNCFSVDGRDQLPTATCVEKDDHRRRNIAILCGIIGGVVLVILTFIGLFFLIKRHRGQAEAAVVQHVAPKVHQQDDEHHPQSMISSDILASARLISQVAKMENQSAPSYRVFSVDELEEATKNFDDSNFLGEGSLGKVYKGRLENGSVIAVRDLALCKKHSTKNLRIRLDSFSKLRHPHLVGLLGHCIRPQDETANGKLFLVQEFVPNGNFRTHLAETLTEKLLTWPDRLAVLIGVAKAVHFLHTGVIPPSLNNQLKTNNVMIDEHGIAKLSDYGMSFLSDELEKSTGKRNVEDFGETVDRDDVYNFGFILLESLVGPVTSSKGESHLLNEMASFSSQDGRWKMVDPIVLTTSSQESLSVVMSITNKCIISSESVARPSFEEVLWNLQYAAQVQGTADADQKSDTQSLH
ncbi:hypothetical protein M569_03829 [Genlisea aurea]|uniref:Protein kinase domain-containing protein n=1 Tax=Genlisea aurea TaxID=192259 RepID=S8CVS5_9LAMI|nr:hypothetical protein M569_03829 [Genlisea aurea]